MVHKLLLGRGSRHAGNGRCFAGVTRFPQVSRLLWSGELANGKTEGGIQCLPHIQFELLGLFHQAPSQDGGLPLQTSRGPKARDNAAFQAYADFFLAFLAFFLPAAA